MNIPQRIVIALFIVVSCLFWYSYESYGISWSKDDYGVLNPTAYHQRGEDLIHQFVIIVVFGGLFLLVSPRRKT